MGIYNDIKSLNIQQFADSSNFNKLLEVFASTFDELQTVFDNIKLILSIDNSSGKQLDLIGHIIVQSRNGQSDVDYRKSLKIKIFKNSSKAFVEDVIKILKLITEATRVVYSDNPPASYTIYTDGEVLPSTIHRIMDRLSAAGVSVLVYASDGETPFIMTEVATTESDLVDNNGDEIVDNLTNQMIVNYDAGEVSESLKQIFAGERMGAIETLDLISNTGDTIITDTGAIIGCYDEDQNIVDGGKLNLAYQ